MVRRKFHPTRKLEMRKFITQALKHDAVLIYNYHNMVVIERISVRDPR